MKNQGTPKTLAEAINNGFWASVGSPVPTSVIESHVKDFIRNKLAAYYLIGMDQPVLFHVATELAEALGVDPESDDAA